jgi:N4-gp56 family major capsid protein
MADAYTGTSAVDYDQTAWNLVAYYALRPQLYADQFATVGTAPQSTPGTAVTFTFAADMAAATTALTETVTPDSVAISDTQTTLTLAEYGNVVKKTRFLRANSFIPLDPIVANLVGYNAALSMDTLAMNALNGGTNVDFGGTETSRVTIANTDIITGANCRLEFARLASANVMPFQSGLYTAFIHPDVAYDLRAATDLAGWRAANTYVDAANLRSGDMGEFEGFRFIRSPRAGLLDDAGAGSGATTTDVYQTLFFGQDALAKAHSIGADAPGEHPIVQPGPVTDPLYRFAPIGWYWIGAYGVFRQACLRRLETASSIGGNAA